MASGAAGPHPHAGVRPADPEAFEIDDWTTAEGLPQNTINEILVGADGEIWLATFGGLVRFDGERFDIIDIARDDGLPSNRITGMAVAAPRSIWFVTQEGYLGRVDDDRVRTVLSPNPRMSDLISIVAADGHLLAQDEDGGLWQSDGTAPWAEVPGLPTDPGAGLNMVARRPSGGAWVGSEFAVSIATPSRIARTIATPPHFALAPAGADGVWLGLQDGLARLDGAGRVETLEVRPALVGQVTVIRPVTDTILWVAAGGEVSQVSREPEGHWTRRRLPLDLGRDHFIRALLVDAEGSLWIGTNGRGLHRAHHPAGQRFGSLVGVRAIDAIVPDGEGGAFLAGSCRGIAHVDAAGRTTMAYAASTDERQRPGGCGLALAPAGPGEVWVRWRADLYRLRRAPATLEPVPVTLPADGGPIASDHAGGLWVASRDGTLRHVRGDRVVATQVVGGTLFSLAVGRDGTVWLGGEGVVHHVTPSGIRRYGAAEGTPRGAVRDILVDGPDRAWLATYGGGLGVLRDGRVTRLTTAHGLPDNAISRLLDDGQGRLWMSTNRGVAVVPRADIEGLLLGGARALAPVVLGSDRGVPEANFGQPAGMRDPQGRLWFGTIDGAVRLDASAFPFNRHAPVGRIDRVWVDEQSLPATPVVAIPAGTSRVRIAFSAGSPLHSAHVRYRFRIEGIDRDWVNAGPQRYATWTPSRPGRYRFLLQARNEDGVWATEPEVIELDVQPLWWQTTTARLGGVLLLLVALVGAYRWRVGHLERRHAERLRVLEERRRTEEQALALRSQLEHVSRVAIAGELAASLAHEVNQPLTAIVANAEAAQHVLASTAPEQTDAQEMLGDIVTQGLRASEVVQGLREFLRSGHPERTAVDLSAVARDMLPLLRRELDHHGVSLALDLAPDLPAVQGRRVQLGQVLANLVMNACEALEGASGERRLTIRTRARDGHVDLEVADTGPGVPREIAERVFEPFVTTKPKGLGMGLAICRSIAEAHRGRLSIETAPEGGARCVLSLPVTTG